MIHSQISGLIILRVCPWSLLIYNSWKSSPFSPTQLNRGEFHSCRDLAGCLLELCSEAIEKPSQSRYSLQSQQPVWFTARGDSNFTPADAMRTVIKAGSLLFLLINAKWLQMVAKPPHYSQGSIGLEIESCSNRIPPCVETAEAQYLLPNHSSISLSLETVHMLRSTTLKPCFNSRVTKVY